MSSLLAANEEALLFTIAIIFLVLLAWIVHLEFRLRRFMRGNTAGNLEGVIQNIIKEHKSFTESQKTLERSTDELRKLLGGAVRGVSVIRFNSLTGDTSGKQSFSTAILSEHGDGVVLTSMSTREHVRLYAKPIRSFATEYELTSEEKQAIVEARKKCGALK